MAPYTIAQSGAFRETFDLSPSGSGVLDGLTFAVKDLIDVAGRKTGCGNPRWLETHPPAAAHALCVELLLAAGARAIGKTHTDEFAYSLLGENFFYGTPLNPRAPDRVPGGSSNGSASAVACGLADFALGTDTGGSVRVPAANVGIFGYRPSHGRISVAGVSPLAPSFDTVGVLASSIEILTKAMTALLLPEKAAHSNPGAILMVREAFQICDPEVKNALQAPLKKLHHAFENRVREISMREIDGDASSSDLMNWYEIYRVLQRAESRNCLGPWMDAENPPFGPTIAETLELSRTLDRSLIPAMAERREDFTRRLKSTLQDTYLLCVPTAASPAPLKGSIRKREQDQTGYYSRSLSITSIAGVARAPQITLPVAEVEGAPFGLSFIARSGNDAFLLACANTLFHAL